MNVNEIISKSKEIGMLQQDVEISMLASFIAALRPHNILEIGSWKGGVFYMFSQLATGTKVSIDLDCYGDLTCTMDERNRQFKTWSNDVHTILGNSHDQQTLSAVKGIMGAGQIDFLFIDGDHTRPGVQLDYAMYSPLVRKGGWVGFHDINDTPFHRARSVAVCDFWSELTGDKMEFNIHGEWGGIGLVRV
jgi:cephalosporin hydroxylase